MFSGQREDPHPKWLQYRTDDERVKRVCASGGLSDLVFETLTRFERWVLACRNLDLLGRSWFNTCASAALSDLERPKAGELYLITLLEVAADALEQIVNEGFSVPLSHAGLLS